MWYFFVFILCSLFISFLSSVAVFISQILTVKYSTNINFDTRDFIQCSLLGLIPFINILCLLCATIDVIEIFLKKSGYIESINKYITSLIKGEEE